MKETSKSLVEQYSDKDWIWKWDIIERPSKNFLNQWRIQYNQKEVHKNSCFAHWPFTAITAITGHKFSLDERKKIVNEMWTKDWADPEWWWKFQESVNFMCKYVNDNWILGKNQKLVYYRIPNRQWEEAEDKDYMIVTWYIVQQWNSADRKDDWSYNKSLWEYGKNYWGHCICICKVNWNKKLVDNYKWRSYNIVNWYDWLKMYTNWYIFAIKEDIKDWYEWLSLADKTKKLASRPKAKRARKKVA